MPQTGNAAWQKGTPDVSQIGKYSMTQKGTSDMSQIGKHRKTDCSLSGSCMKDQIKLEIQHFNKREGSRWKNYWKMNI